jgi:putative two-component system response regulator
MSVDPGRRVLVVDDEKASRDILVEFVRRMGHLPTSVGNGAEALAALDAGFDLLLIDGKMPDMDGFELARQIRAGAASSDVPVIMVTALNTREDRIRAIEAGANDFIAKPVDRIEFGVRVDAQLKLRQTLEALRRHEAELERMVEERTEALRQALAIATQQVKKIREGQLDTIHRLAIAAELNDEATGVHLQRMSRFAELIAREIGLSEIECQAVLDSSPMHDVGKIGIPDSILLKPARLTKDEWAIMKTHTTIGSRILSGSRFRLLQAGEEIAISHHERWDGTGYPNGLVREEIPLCGRICAIADVFDAFTSKRPYKDAFLFDHAVTMLRAGKGLHFDPELLDAFLSRLADVKMIMQRHKDAS